MTREGIPPKLIDGNDSLKTGIIDAGSGNPTGVQYPLCVDGDSVYAKDVWVDESNINTFTGGVITDLFDNLNTVISDTTSNNPKELFIHFNRTTIITAIALGAFSGDFSNVKISILVSGNLEADVIDESADGTKYTSRQWQLPAVGFNAIRIQFHTADTVTLSNIFMLKALARVSRISIQKPDNEFVEAQGTQKGNFKVSLEEFDGSFDTSPLPIKINGPLTAFGDLRTAELHPQFQGSFEYTVDNTDLNENTLVLGGTVTQGSGMAAVGTSTTTGSSAMLASKRHARYKSGLGGVSRFTVRFDEPVADTEQYVGLADEKGSSAAFKNGYIIGYDGLTLGYHRFQNDTKITTAIADWDDPLDGSGASGETIVPGNLNVFFTQYQYLGGGAINIFWEKPSKEVILVHTNKYAGLFTEPSTHNPNFHFVISANNKATSSDLVVRSSSYSYFVEGKTKFIELHQPLNSTEIIEKTGIGATETAILTIRNKALYASKTNFIDIHIQDVTAAIEAANANNLGDIRVVKNATLGGTPSYSDINTTNSVIEIDTAGTTVTGGTLLLPIILAGKNDSSSPPDVYIKQIILGPGETLTISGTNTTGTATFRAFMQWQELF